MKTHGRIRTECREAEPEDSEVEEIWKIKSKKKGITVGIRGEG